MYKPGTSDDLLLNRKSDLVDKPYSSETEIEQAPSLQFEAIKKTVQGLCCSIEQKLDNTSKNRQQTPATTAETNCSGSTAADNPLLMNNSVRLLQTYNNIFQYLNCLRLPIRNPPD
ncbi:hypothetical protein M9H77_04347 [Catharanthus roseus]|uniref:Uncharacterized protein n=1 Tax=Catharanthus roseus TaxID=4058 RepID=A0ACC0CDU3_CATRO|nr:hypothetical protein M9H77_04347 [Catharanthus roseus]